MNDTPSFRWLHRKEHVLVLPNAWDAATARLFERAGAEAIATTSAGFAWANGYADGRRLPQRILLDGVAAIARVTKIPLTVDLEAGYSDDSGEVAELVRSLLAITRMSGINIEDGNAPPALLEDKIRAIGRVAAASGADLFINARTDVYLARLVPAADALGETLERAARYEAAGCDGVFVPGLSDPRQLAKIVQATGLPVNVLASSQLPPIDDLRKIGVRRVSVGSAIALQSYGMAQHLANIVLQQGRTDALYAAGSLSYSEMNDVMASIEGER